MPKPIIVEINVLKLHETNLTLLHLQAESQRLSKLRQTISNKYPKLTATTDNKIINFHQVATSTGETLPGYFSEFLALLKKLRQDIARYYAQVKGRFVAYSEEDALTDLFAEDHELYRMRIFFDAAHRAVGAAACHYKTDHRNENRVYLSVTAYIEPEFRGAHVQELSKGIVQQFLLRNMLSRRQLYAVASCTIFSFICTKKALNSATLPRFEVTPNTENKLRIRAQVLSDAEKQLCRESALYYAREDDIVYQDPDTGVYVARHHRPSLQRSTDTTPKASSVERYKLYIQGYEGIMQQAMEQAISDGQWDRSETLEQFKLEHSLITVSTLSFNSLVLPCFLSGYYDERKARPQNQIRQSALTHSTLSSATPVATTTTTRTTIGTQAL